jgi:hypothetical protein
VFVDEAHFIPRLSIENGPLAMLAEDSVIILASTPPTKESGIQTILDGEWPPGKKICYCVDLEFNCPACKKIQVTDPSHMCECRLHLRPFQQNLDALMIARAAYGAESEAYRREMLGSACVGMHDFIREEFVQKIRENELVKSSDIKKKPEYVFVSCDPSGASKKEVDGGESDYAIVTAFFDGLRLVVRFFYLFIYILQYGVDLQIFVVVIIVVIAVGDCHSKFLKCCLCSWRIFSRCVEL